jgi:hypothetical protein
MSPLVALTPIWIALEVVQLVICERYLGIKHIQLGKDPRGNGPSEIVSFFWCFAVLGYGAWMAAMLFFHLGFVQILALALVTLAGYSLRRVCGLKWVLVVLTFEGAIRIGMLVSLSVLLWKDRLG